MAGLSRYSAQRIFDMMLNPSTRSMANYLALHRGAVDDEAYGNEANFANYNRMALNSLLAEVTPSVDGEVTLEVTNGARVVFPASGGPYNLITHWAIWDSATPGDGNVLFSGALALNRVVEDGDAAILRQGELTLYLI